MINLEMLNRHKQVFGFFAQQLTYPEKLDFNPVVIEESADSSHPAYPYLNEYWNLIRQYSMEQIEEMYVQTFDFEKRSTLYMTYFKFEDSRERGRMLAQLKSIYQLYGLEMMKEELSDYLPLMCEFLYAADWQEDPKAAEHLEMVLAVMEDGTYHLLKALEKAKSPYYPLIKGLRETFKACIQQEVSAHEHA